MNAREYSTPAVEVIGFDTKDVIREVVLTGIETASYGKDLRDCDLSDLLQRVDRIPRIGRVRLGSLDPSLIKDAFVEKIAPLGSLAPYFHLSMQSGSDAVLARMKRKYNTKMAHEAMQRLRRAMPDVQFTTDIIVGFPGETEEDFNRTLEFAREAGFLMIHVFPYSKRKGTPAATMPDQVPDEIKHERVAVLSALQKEIRQKILHEQIGREVSVLLETFRNDTATGHTKSFIEVECPIPHPLRDPLVTVHITHADELRCYGEIVTSHHEI